MSKEEKLEAIRKMQNFLVDFELCGEDKYDEYLIDLLELNKKLLSLPTRTIENIEVGDMVVYKDKAGNNEVIFINGFFNQFQARYVGSNLDYIIPHQALELLKEVVGNE